MTDNKNSLGAQRNKVETPGAIIESGASQFIRLVFAGEAIFTIIIALPYVLDPHATLQRDLVHPSPSNPQAVPSLESASLLQWIGVSTMTLSVLLLVGLPSRQGAVEIRKAVYMALAAWEVLWISVILWQGSVGSEVSGLRIESCLKQIVVPMASFLVFRIWVLLVTPHWFGTYAVKRD